MSVTNSFGEYLKNLLEQPQAVRDTIAALTQLEAVRRFSEQIQSGEIRAVVLTGMGSSFHALQPLSLKLVSYGVNAQRIETSELIHHAPRLMNSRNLVIAVSQSGESIEIVKLLERRRTEAFVLVGISNTPNSPLAMESDVVLLTRAGSEGSVSSKTYVAALAALDLLGAALTRRDYKKERDALERAPSEMEHYLAPWREYIEDLSARLKEIETVVLVGRGASLAAVGAGALILREAARVPCLDLSSAAFRHGPMELLSPRTFVVVFRGAAPTMELNTRLVTDIRAAGGQAELVSESTIIPAFALPVVPPTTLPLLEILVPEMLSLALARLRGIVPGKFHIGAKITRTE